MGKKLLKVLRVAVYVTGGICLLGVLLVFLFLYFGIPAIAEYGFRNEFAPDEKYSIDYSDSDRAVAFGGRIGLGRLRRLSQDTTINPEGRKKAVLLSTYIESGLFVLDLRREFLEVRERHLPISPIDRYGYFILWREFKADQYNGQSTNPLANGATYIGEMYFGKATGEGTETWRDGRKYRGWFIDGKPYAMGVFTWPDGRKYVGRPIDSTSDLPNGSGIMTYPDGRQYNGHFKDGKMNGTGRMTYPDGKVEEGLWNDGKFMGTSTSPP